MYNTKPETKEQLIELLTTFNITHSEWLKPVASLLKELKENDCYLKVVDGKLQRFVDVVKVRCYYSNLQLFEEKQVFEDGKVRNRGHDHVAEKMKQNENLFVAAVRALKEELQIDCTIDELIHQEELDMIGSTNANPSYGMLKSEYRYFNFMIKLTDEQYAANGYQEVKDGKVTYFTWRAI